MIKDDFVLDSSIEYDFELCYRSNVSSTIFGNFRYTCADQVGKDLFCWSGTISFIIRFYYDVWKLRSGKREEEQLKVVLIDLFSPVK